MILADTSIWIEFLKRNEPYFTAFRSLLENQEIITQECVFGELLQGVKDKREKTIIQEYWNHLPKILSDNLFIKAGLYSSDNKLLDKGIGLIDSLIIVSAHISKSKIWTLDKKLLNYLDKNIIFSLK